MFDGTTKLLKDIQIGEQLKGYYIPGMIDESEEGWQDWTGSTNSEGVYKAAKVISILESSYSFYYFINNDIKITVSHPILINKENTDIWSWVDTPFIEVGDNLKGTDKKIIKVESVEKINESIEVIILDVEEIDNYFAGKDPIVVHNSDLKQPV